MQRLAAMLAAAVGLGLPVAALAQTASRSDLAYCTALSDIYARYIGHDENYTSHGLVPRGDAEAYVSIAKCREGETAPANPGLERKLTDAKFTLPPRG